MKLVFYSGGHDFQNVKLDEALLKLVKSPSPQISYIPACSYMSESEFLEFVIQYEKFNIHNILHFPVDVPYTEVLLKQVLKSDIIHLSGGNTYYFLKHLRHTGMLKELKKYVASGGILTGLSAGAIMMTPTIMLAGIPSFDCDENDEHLRNLKAMNLVDFEFFPHYKNSNRYDAELKKYSRQIDIPIFACPDGSGIIVNDSELSFVGRAFCFSQGKKILINNVA
jgi:dipeptidase E